MSRNIETRLRVLGKIILVIGLIALAVGIILLITTAAAFAFWITVASIVLNVVGITLMTMKIY